MNTLRLYDGSGRTLRAVGVHQCHLVAFAAKYRGWHTAAKDRVTRRALAGAARRGLVRVVGDQFKFVEVTP